MQRPGDAIEEHSENLRLSGGNIASGLVISGMAAPCRAGPAF